MKKKYSDIGNRLKILRGNVTQANFAAKHHKTTRTYQYYESGERKPDLSFVKEIAKEYGKSIDWIMCINDHESRNESYNDQKICRDYNIIPNIYGSDTFIQAMADIKEIFDSGDSILIPAIQANLNAFKHVLHRERQFRQILDENNELRSRISKLEAICNDIPNIKVQLETLQEENRTLRAENNRLKATYAPPSGDAGNLTNTNTEKSVT